jgi:hypothetical protein
VGTGFPLKRCGNKELEHRAEKWEPVFRLNDAATMV